MSLIDEIRIAQRDAGEAAVIRNLESLGLGAVGNYATAEETAAVMRPATANETWLHSQLDRIAPNRHEMGSAGDTPALVKLVFELREAKTQLQGEAGVYCALLGSALDVLETIADGESEDWMMLTALKTKIRAAIEARPVQP